MAITPQHNAYDYVDDAVGVGSGFPARGSLLKEGLECVIFYMRAGNGPIRSSLVLPAHARNAAAGPVDQVAASCCPL